MAKERWTAGHIRTMLELYAHTDHERFETQRAEAEYYTAVLGRYVAPTTVGRIKNNQWYYIGAGGAIEKSPDWPTNPKPAPIEGEQTALFDDPEKADLAATFAAVLEEIGKHLDIIERLGETARELTERLNK